MKQNSSLMLSNTELVETPEVGRSPSRSQLSSRSEVALVGQSPVRSSSSGQFKNPSKNSSKMPQIIEFQELEMVQEVGNGNFGKVFEASWRGIKVAVKKMPNDMYTSIAEKERFVAEAHIMSCMKPHENVVTLYGVCEQPLCIVMEFVAKGSLDAMLLAEQIPMKLKVNFIRDIAAGLMHLSKEGIVHKDLAARNVLITKFGTAKIADFGLARKYELTHYSLAETGPLLWMAPESLIDGAFNEKTDVWMFAVTCVEILSNGERPYYSIRMAQNLGLDEVAKGIMEGTITPQPSSTCDPDLARVLKQCVKLRPEDRLSFAEIVRQMNTIVAKYDE